MYLRADRDAPRRRRHDCRSIRSLSFWIFLRPDSGIFAKSPNGLQSRPIRNERQAVTAKVNQVLRVQTADQIHFGRSSSIRRHASLFFADQESGQPRADSQSFLPSLDW